MTWHRLVDDLHHIFLGDPLSFMITLQLMLLAFIILGALAWGGEPRRLVLKLFEDEPESPSHQDEDHDEE